MSKFKHFFSAAMAAIFVAGTAAAEWDVTAPSPMPDQTYDATWNPWINVRTHSGSRTPSSGFSSIGACIPCLPGGRRSGIPSGIGMI